MSQAARKPARGISIGIIAQGRVAVGVVAIGGVSIGVVALGGISIGLLALGGVTIGGMAVGALAIGWNATGAIALGLGKSQGAWFQLGSAAIMLGGLLIAGPLRFLGRRWRRDTEAPASRTES